MKQTLIAVVVAMLLTALGVATGAHYFYGLRAAKLQSVIDAQTIEAGKQETLLQAERLKAADDQKTAVLKIQGESNDALYEKQAANDKLSACLNSGACRLRYGPSKASVPVGIVPKTSVATASSDAAGGELDADARQTYLSLRAGIERQQIALTACQKYADELQK